MVQNEPTQSKKPGVPAVQSLERAVRILLAFSAERPSLGLSELARAVGLSKSTVRRLLLTLEDLQLVRGDPATQTYKLGATCLRLGYAAYVSMDLRAVARPILDQLARSTGTTAYLFSRVSEGAVCVDIIENFQAIRVMHTGIGTVFPLNVGAAPRALLAGLDEAALRAFAAGEAKAYTPATLTTADELIADVRQTAASGIVISIDDLTEGAAGIGAPVYNHEGRITAAISIGGLKERFGPDQRGELGATVRKAADQISASLGFRGT